MFTDQTSWGLNPIDAVHVVDTGVSDYKLVVATVAVADSVLRPPMNNISHYLHGFDLANFIVISTSHHYSHPRMRTLTGLQTKCSPS